MTKLKDTLSLMNWWIIVLCFAGFTYQEENFAIVTQYITVPLAFAYQWLGEDDTLCFIEKDFKTNKKLITER
jgi:hypothetical protein